MFPEGFIRRIKTQEYLDPDGLLKALNEPSPVSLRINPLKWNRRPLDSDPVTWCSTGYYLTKRPSFTLDPLFHAGCYYPQEASGMFIEQVCEHAVQGTGYLKVLDLCASPGGKSTHLSSLIGPGNLLVANEVIRSRSDILVENTVKWGAANIIVTRNDPSAFSRMIGFFDAILVDAPCSGEGMFRDRIAVDEWSVKNTLLCSERQKRILSDVWPALRSGGILIYSTCTFNPGENEENVKWLTETEEAGSVNLDLKGFDEIVEIEYKGITGYGFYPGKLKGEGLFISVIRKTGNSGRSESAIMKRNGRDIRKADRDAITQWSLFNSERLIRKGEEIYYIPCRIEDFTIINDFLTVIVPGVKICSEKKNGYVPAYELAVSTGIKSDAFTRAELDYIQALKYLRKETLDPGNMPKGWFIAAYNGVNLGFANNIGSRINNYFPVNQRIRMKIPDDPGRDLLKWEILETDSDGK